MSSKVGVIIGRFQPFHKGHAWLIKKALDRYKKLIIIIGSSNISDGKNLWSFEKRKRMLERFLKKEGLKEKILKIEKVKDVPDDKEWLDKTLKKIGKDDFTVIGDNEWVNGIFENYGYDVWRAGFYKRENYEGEKIRNLYLNNLRWEDRVPEYVVPVIKEE